MLRAPFRLVATGFFILAGAFHFLRPALYVSIMPPMLPAPLVLVYLSGVAEILGGLGLLLPATRRLAGWGLIALLFAVWPANLYMALIHFRDWSAWVLWLRLPFQLVFMAWVYWVAQLAPGNRQPGRGG